MLQILLEEEENIERIGKQVFFMLYILGMATFLSIRFFRFLEMAYVEYIDKKLFYTHLNVGLKKLQPHQQVILKRKFRFYQYLTPKQQSFFEHRVARFLREKEFVGKGLEVTDEMQVLVAATAVKMMFGLRDYRLQIIQTIFIYPEAYYSRLNDAYHKGEFNPQKNLLVFSWEDFKDGYQIDDDNINLAIHEIVHAIHFNFLSRRGKSASAGIFLNSHAELVSYLNNHPKVLEEMQSSGYFRAYGFTNDFELLAVIMENFIETPEMFKREFPHIYRLVKQMLNFHFKGY